MNELDIFLNAVEITNNKYVSNGKPSGFILANKYLYYGDNTVFTRDNGARYSLLNVDRNMVLQMVRSKIVEEAMKITEKDGILCDNEILNGIIDFVIKHDGNFDFNDCDMINNKIDELINRTIEIAVEKARNNQIDERPIGSDVIVNAIKGNTRILKVSNDMDNVYHNLFNIHQMIDPTLEVRSLYFDGNERSGR